MTHRTCGFPVNIQREKRLATCSEIHYSQDMTTKQQLLAHLAEFHGGKGYQTHRLSRWNARMTLAQLQKAHGYMHHHYSGALAHFHQGPNDPPHLGPDSRPAGWKTGADTKEKS